MSEPLAEAFLENVRFEFARMKKLCEGAITQLGDEQLSLSPAKDSNSVSVLMRHMAGNMLSRWTDFLSSDGEKPWRDRDAEFEDAEMTREELLAYWEKGWSVFLETLHSLQPSDLQRNVTIRGESLTVLQAILRQTNHYSYHTGQLVYVARYFSGERWKSLSIPKGRSQEFNQGTYLKP